MRILKFRAWDGEGMKLAFELTQNPKYWWKENKDYPLMQFTGLHDVNGVEIYEGDIVKVANEEFSHAVEWISQDEYGFPIGWGMFPKNFEYEVIGDIYENPELLEVE